jgi:hypothetical protein
MSAGAGVLCIVPGAVPGVLVAPGVGVPGAVSGVAVVPPGGGGPASGCPGICAGGIRVWLDESAGLAALGASGGVTVSVGRLGAGAGGVTSFLSVALAPKGLRDSSELCASIVPLHPAQLGCSDAARGSASLTSAGIARSTA